jgi:hypothetical protein
MTGNVDRTITIKVTDEEEMAVVEALKPYRKMVSDSAPLTSILYDIDLLPEQIRLMPIRFSPILPKPSDGPCHATAAT